MKLNFGQIQALTKGAEYLSEEADGLCFHRFTPKDDASSTPDSPSICLADAGIKLAFRTNSRYLRIKGKTFLVNSIRSFYAIDLVKDGVLVDSIQNTSENELSPFISTNEYPLGYFEKEFALGNGEKSIELHLPHSTGCLLSELSIEDGADISPLPAQKVWLAYGDSITQGYDVLQPRSAIPPFYANAFIWMSTTRPLPVPAFLHIRHPIPKTFRRALFPLLTEQTIFRTVGLQPFERMPKLLSLRWQRPIRLFPNSSFHRFFVPIACTMSGSAIFMKLPMLYKPSQPVCRIPISFAEKSWFQTKRQASVTAISIRAKSALPIMQKIYTKRSCPLYNIGR